MWFLIRTHTQMSHSKDSLACWSPFLHCVCSCAPEARGNVSSRSHRRTDPYLVDQPQLNTSGAGSRGTQRFPESSTNKHDTANFGTDFWKTPPGSLVLIPNYMIQAKIRDWRQAKVSPLLAWITG